MPFIPPLGVELAFEAPAVPAVALGVPSPVSEQLLDAAADSAAMSSDEIRPGSGRSDWVLGMKVSWAQLSAVARLSYQQWASAARLCGWRR
jgi:hypothetical protein